MDTNVLISATFWAGDSDKILRKAERKEFELIMSKDILEEFVGVLGYKEIQEKIRDKGLEIRRTVEKVISISTFVEPKERHKIIIDDPDDDKFLDCAVAGNASIIISQDKHLLKLKEFKGVRIVSPADFLKEKAR